MNDYKKTGGFIAIIKQKKIFFLRMTLKVLIITIFKFKK